MKTNLFFQKDGLVAPKRSKGGSITVVFIALLAIMMILVVAETRAIIQLRREEKLLEQKQIERFAVPPTNNAPVVARADK